MTSLLSNFHASHPSDNLALAGGCALNSSYNGQITHKTDFSSLYIPSAPADEGTALGAAWLAFAKEQGGGPALATPLTAYLGSTRSAEASWRSLEARRTRARPRRTLRALREKSCRPPWSRRSDHGAPC